MEFDKWFGVEVAARPASWARGSPPARSPRCGAGGASMRCLPCCHSDSPPWPSSDCRPRTAPTGLRRTHGPSSHLAHCSGGASSCTGAPRVLLVRIVRNPVERTAPVAGGCAVAAERDPDRTVRHRRARGRSRRRTRGTVGGCRMGRPGHRSRADPARPRVGSDRATAVVTVARHHRHRGSRLRSPGRPCEQPAPAHRRAPGSRQQPHRQLHGLLLTRSALGEAATTALFTTHGWVGSSLLGVGFAASALAVLATDRRHPATARTSDPTQQETWGGGTSLTPARG